MLIQMFKPQPILKSIADTSRFIDLIYDFVKTLSESELEVIVNNSTRWHEMSLNDQMPDVIIDIDSLAELGALTIDHAASLKTLIKEVTEK